MGGIKLGLAGTAWDCIAVVCSASPLLLCSDLLCIKSISIVNPVLHKRATTNIIVLRRAIGPGIGEGTGHREGTGRAQGQPVSRVKTRG